MSQLGQMSLHSPIRNSFCSLLFSVKTVGENRKQPPAPQLLFRLFNRFTLHLRMNRCSPGIGMILTERSPKELLCISRAAEHNNSLVSSAAGLCRPNFSQTALICFPSLPPTSRLLSYLLFSRSRIDSSGLMMSSMAKIKN